MSTHRCWSVPASTLYLNDVMSCQQGLKKLPFCTHALNQSVTVNKTHIPATDLTVHVCWSTCYLNKIQRNYNWTSWRVQADILKCLKNTFEIELFRKQLYQMYWLDHNNNKTLLIIMITIYGKLLKYYLAEVQTDLEACLPVEHKQTWINK